MNELDRKVSDYVTITRAARNFEDDSFGVEVEMEFGHDEIDDLFNFYDHWTGISDGSLSSGVEFVSRGAMPRDKLTLAIQELEAILNNHDLYIKPSIRAGVHVHFNMLNRTFKQCIVFGACYYILEELLTRWCGEDREGNLFCLRGVDCEASIQEIANSFGKVSKGYGSIFDMQGIDAKYAALNWVSLFNLGTMEFRAMRTDTDLNTILKWVDILEGIKQKSLEFENGRDVMAFFSNMGIDGFLKAFLGDHKDEVVGKSEEVARKMFNGMELAQDFIHFSGAR